MMKFTLCQNFSEIDPNEWNALLEESTADVPFLRHEYLRAWWETRGGGEWPQAELVLVAARENDQLIGIAPLFLAEHEGQHSLMALGSIEISDYLDVIARKDDLARFISGALDFLASSLTSNWRGFDLYNIPDSSPTLAALKDESEKRGWNYQQEIYRPTPYIALKGDFETYLASVEKKQRHEIRRKVRRAEESGRGVRWYIVRDAQNIESEIQDFLRLMEGDQNKAKFLTPLMREQMCSCILTACQCGWLWLAFLEVDGQKAAAALNFDYKNRLWGYNSGVDRQFMDISPGWVLLAYTLQWAAENGRDEFDFMRGDEEYKYRFGAVNRHVMRVRATKP